MRSWRESILLARGSRRRSLIAYYRSITRISRRPSMAMPWVTSFARWTRALEVRARCDAVKTLFTRWQENVPVEFPHQDLDWRLWSAAAWRARSAVRSQEKALRGVTCWDAGGEAAFGSREWRRPVPGEQWYVMRRQP